ncbi:hypothetical protein TWF281_001358 [Arthrobotrys megalospora]
MEGAHRIYEIPSSERRNGDGRFLRLPTVTDGPFYPLDTIVLPRLRETSNAYFSAPYESDDEIRELDMIHLSSTIGATIWFITDCMLHTEMKDWTFYNQILFTCGVMIAYCILNRYFYHYFSDFLDFQWHEERPLWGKGGMEHFGFVGFWRLWLGLCRVLKMVWGVWKKRKKGEEGRGYVCVPQCYDCLYGDWDEGLGDGFRRSIVEEEEDTESDDDDDYGDYGEGVRLLKLRRSITV